MLVPRSSCHVTHLVPESFILQMVLHQSFTRKQLRSVLFIALSALTPLLHNNAFEISCIIIYYEKWNICSFGANAPVSIIFSKLNLNFS